MSHERLDSSYKPMKEGLVMSTGAEAYKVPSFGIIKIKVHDGSVRNLENVRHISNLKRNLIYFGRPQDCGLR